MLPAVIKRYQGAVSSHLQAKANSSLRFVFLERGFLPAKC